MAKKMKRDGTRSKAIRDLIDANPNITTDEALASLKKQGLSVHKQTYYAVRSAHLKKNAVAIPQIKRKTKKKTISKKAPQQHFDPSVEIEILKRDLRKFKDIMMRLIMD